MRLWLSPENKATDSDLAHIYISRSSPWSLTALAQLTHYLRLLAPASTSSGSQQLRLCDKGVIKSERFAVNEDDPLADVGTWLEALSESRFFTLGSACPLQWLPVLFAVEPPPSPPPSPLSPPPSITMPSPPSPPPSQPTTVFDFSSATTPGWSNGGGDPPYAFTRTEGAVPFIGDGTGIGWFGSYFYVEATRRSPGDLFTLAYNGSVCSDIGQCVSTVAFRYHMYGADMGQLRVTNAEGKAVWSLRGDQGNEWQAVSVGVYSASFAFEYRCGTGFEGDAAVARAAVSCGAAPSPPPQAPPSPPSPPPSPPSPPLQPFSRYAISSSDLIEALNDSAVSKIVLRPGTYEFADGMCSDTPRSDASGTLPTVEPSALCIDRNVTIQAEVAGSVVLDATGARRVIYVSTAGTAQLVGLNITGGYVGAGYSNDGSGAQGGGILIEGSADLTDCNIHGNEADVCSHLNLPCRLSSGGLLCGTLRVFMVGRLAGDSASKARQR